MKKEVEASVALSRGKPNPITWRMGFLAGVAWQKAQATIANWDGSTEGDDAECAEHDGQERTDE